MVERGCCLGFPNQASFDFFFAKHLAGEELQRDSPFEVKILSLPDLAHATLAKLFEDSIVADGLRYGTAAIVGLINASAGQEVPLFVVFAEQSLDPFSQSSIVSACTLDVAGAGLGVELDRPLEDTLRSLELGVHASGPPPSARCVATPGRSSTRA